MRFVLLYACLFLLSVASFADVVNVYERTDVGGAIVQIGERAFETGRNYTSVTAPAKSGFVFTHWTISTTQAFENRDEWGRALDQVSFVVYEGTMLTAHYVPKTLDADGDGVADGFELYWYGNLGQSATSDTDGDGKTFAEELAAGTNPLMAESADAGPIAWGAGVVWLFNPNNYGAVTIRSEPEGALFATSSEVYRPGTRVSTTSKGTYAPETTSFAYWSFNGERIADEWGRAESEKTVVTDGSPLTIVAYAASDYETRMKLYWYGRTDVAMSSDTDGDGKTFAEELAAGTNPLMAESADEGPVKYCDTALTEFNLQPYEQMQGTVVDGNYVQLFHSPIAGNVGAVSFGSAVTPIVADLNNDGRFDLVVLTATATNIYLNVGSSGNPEFEIRTDVDLTSVDLAMNATAKLASFTLDVPATGALSATTNGTELLVSDADGRIWYYTANRTIDPSEQSNNSYILQHKVWGGSYAGFANGLRLAAVDWEDDGDLDCLCGTAEGKLMLLRNPKVGRPTNLAALAGVDSVQLSWDPNAQSRIRGYKVCRQSEELRVQSCLSCWRRRRCRSTAIRRRSWPRTTTA